MKIEQTKIVYNLPVILNILITDFKSDIVEEEYLSAESNALVINHKSDQLRLEIHDLLNAPKFFFFDEEKLSYFKYTLKNKISELIIYAHKMADKLDIDLIQLEIPEFKLYSTIDKQINDLTGKLINESGIISLCSLNTVIYKENMKEALISLITVLDHISILLFKENHYHNLSIIYEETLKRVVFEHEENVLRNKSLYEKDIKNEKN